jgi:hypothetical protein
MMIETLVKQFCTSIHAAAGRTAGSVERGRRSADRQETRVTFVFRNLSIPGDGLFSQCPTNGGAHGRRSYAIPVRPAH